MRRRQESPWLLAERKRIRTEPTSGVAHRLADGENPIAAWRIETGLSTRQLDRKTGIAGHSLNSMELGLITPTPEEIEKIAGQAKADHRREKEQHQNFEMRVDLVEITP